MKKKTQHVLGGYKEKNGHITTYMKTNYIVLFYPALQFNTYGEQICKL